MSKELANRNQESGLVVAGQDAAASISRVALYQGTAQEVEKYGEGAFRRGDFIDTLERTKLGTSVQVMPLAGWTTWSKWPKGSKQPEYTFTRVEDVPSEDLAWTDGMPPSAVECVHLVCVLSGSPFPAVINFKRTAISAFKNVIGPLEQRRGARRAGPGLYELSSTDDKDGAGNPFKRLNAKPAGDPTPEMLELAAAIRPVIDRVKAKYEEIDAADCPV